MPGKSGLDVCREVRSRSPVPIILLTAKDAEVDKVVGLEVGADDYVTKPFSVRELLGRVRAQLRRRELDRSVGTEGADDRGRARSPSTSPATWSRVRGEPVNLTRSEFQVLRLLVEHPGQVFSRKEIMEELWQTEFRGDVRACDVHISNLRQKVERDPQNPELVLTVQEGRLPLRGGRLTRAGATDGQRAFRRRCGTRRPGSRARGRCGREGSSCGSAPARRRALSPVRARWGSPAGASS